MPQTLVRKLRISLLGAVSALALTVGSASVALGELRKDEPAETTQATDASAPSIGARSSGRVTSNGTYVAPDVKPSQRAAFGAKAGKAEPQAPIADAQDASKLTFSMFAGGAGLALLATVGLAFSLSRIVGADGTTSRAMTIGTKLVLGFGVMVTGLLSLATISSWSSAEVATSNSLANFRSEQYALLSEMDGDMLTMRMNMKSFLLTNSESDLKKFSDSAASFVAKQEVAKQTIKNPERIRLLEKIYADTGEYLQTFDKVVAVIDQRNSVIDQEMGPAAVRASDLLSELTRATLADGDARIGAIAAATNERYQLARVAFFRFLRTGEEATAKQAVTHAEAANASMADLEAAVTNPTRKAWLSEARQAVTLWVTKMEHSEKLQQERNTLVKGTLDKIGPVIAETSNAMQASLKKSKAELEVTSAATARSATLMVTAVSLVVMVIGISLSVVILRGITRPLALVVDSLKTVAAGDLTRAPLNMKSHDEIGVLSQATDAMSSSLKKMVAEVKGTSTQVAAAATEVAASAEELAQTVKSQEQAATQVASAVTELSSSITEVANKSSEGARGARESMEQAATGGDLVQQTVSQLGQINERFGEVGTVVTTLEKQGEEVGRIVQVIQDIADQTNLLALNAAIEAARAGEHGRGFAVVADEVRKLAERTTRATGEVASTIGGMQEQTVKAAEAMKIGRQTVEEGAKMGGQAGEAVGLIVKSQKAAEHAASSIAAATQQQASATEEISRTIEQMTAANSQSSGAASQASQAANSLSQQAETLKQAMERYRV